MSKYVIETKCFKSFLSIPTPLSDKSIFIFPPCPDKDISILSAWLWEITFCIRLFNIRIYPSGSCSQIKWNNNSGKHTGKRNGFHSAFPTGRINQSRFLHGKSHSVSDCLISAYIRPGQPAPRTAALESPL